MSNHTIPEKASATKIFLHMEDYDHFPNDLLESLNGRNINVKIDRAKTLDEALNKLIALSNPNTPRYAGLIIDAGFKCIVSKPFEFTLKNGQKCNAQIDIAEKDLKDVRGILLLEKLLTQGYYHCQLPMVIATNAALNKKDVVLAKNRLEDLLIRNGVQSKLLQYGKHNPMPIVDWIAAIIQQSIQ
jgi:hypothetical protein